MNVLNYKFGSKKAKSIVKDLSNKIIKSMSASMLNYYKNMWVYISLDNSRYISNGKIKEYFEKSLIPIENLSLIWDICCQEKAAHLTKNEFYLALRLIALFQNHLEITEENICSPSISLPIFYKKENSDVNKDYIKNKKKKSKLNDDLKKSYEYNNGQINIWEINKNDIKKYFETFNIVDSNKKGFVAGDQARYHFKKSGLSTDSLKKIWALSDINGDNKLGPIEFVIAEHIINVCKRNKIDVPNVLPRELKNVIKEYQ